MLSLVVVCAYGDPMSEAATLIVGADGAGGVIRAPGLQLSMSS